MLWQLPDPQERTAQPKHPSYVPVVWSQAPNQAFSTPAMLAGLKMQGQLLYFIQAGLAQMQET